MGIIVNEANFKHLEKETKERFPKKTADIIIRNLCRALSSDSRWVKISSFTEAFDMAKKENVELPQGDFPVTKFKPNFSMKKEKGLFYRLYESEKTVIKGWHAEAVNLIRSELPECNETITNFVYTIGQHIIKTNSPLPSRNKKGVN